MSNICAALSPDKDMPQRASPYSENGLCAVASP